MSAMGAQQVLAYRLQAPLASNRKQDVACLHLQALLVTQQAQLSTPEVNAQQQS